jgi:hypothetical protein
MNLNPHETERNQQTDFPKSSFCSDDSLHFAFALALPNQCSNKTKKKLDRTYSFFLSRRRFAAAQEKRDETLIKGHQVVTVKINNAININVLSRQNRQRTQKFLLAALIQFSAGGLSSQTVLPGGWNSPL